MGYYVVIRGPLGVGKSTVSRALGKTLGAELVSIDAIADEHWDGGSVRLYLDANKLAAARARNALAHGTPVVLDGCFYWKTQIQDLERRLPYPHLVFSLKAPLSVCIERDSRRPVVHGPSGAEQVFRKVARFDYGIPIDATQRVLRAVREIRSHLPPGGHPRARPS